MAAGGARTATIGLIPPLLPEPPRFLILAFAARGLPVGAAINRLTPHSARGYESVIRSALRETSPRKEISK
jgi:hypothetical protein